MSSPRFLGVSKISASQSRNVVPLFGYGFTGDRWGKRLGLGGKERNFRDKEGRGSTKISDDAANWVS